MRTVFGVLLTVLSGSALAQVEHNVASAIVAGSAWLKLKMSILLKRGNDFSIIYSGVFVEFGIFSRGNSAIAACTIRVPAKLQSGYALTHVKTVASAYAFKTEQVTANFANIPMYLGQSLDQLRLPLLADSYFNDEINLEGHRFYSPQNCRGLSGFTGNNLQVSAQKTGPWGALFIGDIKFDFEATVTLCP